MNYKFADEVFDDVDNIGTYLDVYKIINEYNLEWITDNNNHQYNDNQYNDNQILFKFWIKELNCEKSGLIEIFNDIDIRCSKTKNMIKILFNEFVFTHDDYKDIYNSCHNHVLLYKSPYINDDICMKYILFIELFEGKFNDVSSQVFLRYLSREDKHIIKIILHKALTVVKSGLLCCMDNKVTIYKRLLIEMYYNQFSHI